MEANYAPHDKHGLYAGNATTGPGPALMGADTLMGNDVHRAAIDKLGHIKELMIAMAAGRVAYAVLA